MNERHTIWDWILLLLLCTAGTWARLTHLERIGIRTVDEGSYCWFGLGIIHGDRACILDKPGQALILAGGFALLGISQYVAVVTHAFIGIATLPALYWLGYLMRGRRAGFALASSAALLPYFLLYNRSAASDANSFFFNALGLCLFLLGLRRNGKPHQPPNLKCLALSGGLFGISATVNLASIPPFALTWAFFAVWAWWGRMGLRPAARGLAAMAAGWLLGVALIEVLLAYYIDFEKVWGQVMGHAGQIILTRIRWGWAYHLWRFTGPLEVSLAVLGLLMVRRWWRTPAALFPLLLLALALFYARADLSLPRLHLPLLLGFLPLAALAADSLLERLGARSSSLAEFFLNMAVAAALLASHAAQARQITRLESGYTETCAWLSRNMQLEEQGVSTHSFWTLSAFTGRLFRPGSDPLAEALNADEWRTELLPLLDQLHKKGGSYLVIDYLIFNRLKPKGIEHLREWVSGHPPEKMGGRTIPNPVAGDYQTWADDGLTPPLDRELVAQFIYIYPLGELVQRMSHRVP